MENRGKILDAARSLLTRINLGQGSASSNSYRAITEQFDLKTPDEVDAVNAETIFLFGTSAIEVRAKTDQINKKVINEKAWKDASIE